jgi:hypothetical protein
MKMFEYDKQKVPEYMVTRAAKRCWRMPDSQREACVAKAKERLAKKFRRRDAALVLAFT